MKTRRLPGFFYGAGSTEYNRYEGLNNIRRQAQGAYALSGLAFCLKKPDLAERRIDIGSNQEA